jgi:hypothetical protein
VASVSVTALWAKRLSLLVVVGIVAVGCSGGSKSAEPLASSEEADPSTTSAASVEDSSGVLPLLGSDDFDDGESELFWTGRDELLSSQVVDGELHMDVVLGSSVQALRSTWPPLTAVTLESDFTIVARTLGTFTAGCWADAYEYSLAMTGDQRLTVITRAHADGTATDAEVLADLGYTSLVGSVGDSFRVRVSCFEQDGADWIAGWIDGEPVALVELPPGAGRFDAVGYTATVVAAGDGLVVDNVEVFEGYPSGGVHPSTLPPAESSSAWTVFAHDGVSFEFPSSWVYFELPPPLGTSPDVWSFSSGPIGVSNGVSLLFLGAQFISDVEMTPDQFIAAWLEIQESEGVTMRSDPSTIQVGGKDAILLEFDEIIDGATGLPLVVEQVWVFTDTGTYTLIFRVRTHDEGEYRPAWEQALATLALPGE